MVVVCLLEALWEIEVMSRITMALLRSSDIAARIVLGVGMLAVPVLMPLVSETGVDR